jgi:uncharacterized protein (TIGR02145 family)
MNPNFSSAYNNRGSAYSNKGDYDRALADYNQAIRLNPSNAKAYYNRGIAYYYKKDYNRAIAEWESTLRIDPNDTDARENIEIVKNQLNSNSSDAKNDAEEYLKKGKEYYEKEDYDRAIANFTEAIRLNPNYADAYNYRGITYDDKKDYDRAIADYNQAIRLNPNFAGAYFNRGLAYDNKKDYNRAIADYSEAIRLNPNYVGAYNNRGIAYKNKGDYDRAIADYTEVIRLNPNYTMAYNNRGIAYYNKKDYNRAIADWESALRIDPNNAKARENIEFVKSETAAQASVGSFIDKRDGKVYKTVKIGNGQTWMAENLNYAANGSVCYDNKAVNCAKYGRLYDWSTTMKVCPVGTHLPTDKEWETLVDYAGGDKKAGEKLKSTNGWDGNGNGTDEYGFSALPGGSGNSTDGFSYAGECGIWWSATKSDDYEIWIRAMTPNESVLRTDLDKVSLFSVRCVVDK